ncbi:MFS transporter [Micromonospora craterilacus]|uniref:MFS transporter n=1 Tax=Micromonospora craterilacus TaxID=1655439 RepID=A0A2W2F267_9ACTN|nr:MFS transporter [Micromonospora craterilacus]PZG19890.1 MFS transporter [Micromonospora craterilacus]
MSDDTRTSSGADTATAAAPAPAPPDEFVPPITGRKRTLALVVVLTGFVLDLLDITIVNVALPSIRDGINATASTMQWLVAGYALAFASTLIISGRLGDIVGVRRMFLIGVAGFTFTSLLAGIAQTPEQLIVLRFLQGAMGAVMVPQVYTLIQLLYAPKERGKAFAAMSAALAFGTVGGPLVGALLTTANVAGLGWRSIFLVNVPIGIAAFIAARALLPESARRRDRLDLVGAALITVAVLLIVYPLVQGREQDWPVWTYASMAGGLAVFAVFVLHQRARTESPLVPMSLFRHRSFNSGLVVVFLFQGAVMSFFLVITIYLQIGVGFSILRAGLSGLPWDIAVPLLGWLSARAITPKLGRVGLQIGLLLLIGSMLWFMWVIHATPQVSIWQLLAPMFVGGAGMGMTFPPLMGYSLHDVPGEQAGSASGVVNANYQIGVTLGIAACGTLFFSLLAVQAPAAVDDVAPRLRADLVATGVSDAQAGQIGERFRDCLTTQLHAADPTLAPAGCDSASLAAGGGDTTARVIEERAFETSQVSFQRAMVGTLWYSVISFALALLGSFLLPRR